MSFWKGLFAGMVALKIHNATKRPGRRHDGFYS